MIATNAMMMKERNKRLIIQLILKHQYSRAELAEHTSLTKAAVSVIVEELMAGGIVRALKSERTQVGRRPVRLAVNGDFMYAVGINLTRSRIDVGLADIGGNVLAERHFEALPPHSAAERIEGAVRELLAESGLDRERILGVGVTAPGPLDARSRTILNPPGFAAWHGACVDTLIGERLGKPCYLANISGALALCEKYYGTAKDKSDFLLLTVSDGIGSGLVIGDKLSDNLSELGHTSIHYNGRPCQCGNAGCVECYASIPAILQGTAHQSWQEAVDAHDTALIEREAEYLGCAMINAVNTLGLRDIILDGEITYRPRALIEGIEARLARNTMTKERPNVTVSGGFSSVLCAAVSAFDAYFSSP